MTKKSYRPTKVMACGSYIMFDSYAAVIPASVREDLENCFSEALAKATYDEREIKEGGK